MVEENGLFKVGSRKSELALIQTNCVIENLKTFFPKKEFETVTMSTTGDKILDKPLPKIGEKSLFTKELEIALEENKVDFVVHSLKDLPTSLPNGLAIGAILKREDPRDAVILHAKHRGCTLSTLPDNSVIGTSSLRRTSQLKRKFPKLEIKDIRGNLQTRLRKLDQGLYDGIILAVAGILRMGWEHRISQILGEKEMLYAVGQGALAVECRVEDCKIFAQLSHEETVLRTVAERSLLSALEAGCSAPIAVSTAFDDGILSLNAGVWSLDGSVSLFHSLETSVDTHFKGDSIESKKNLFNGLSDVGLNSSYLSAAFELGQNLAKELLAKGALKIITEAKAENEAPS